MAFSSATIRRSKGRSCISCISCGACSWHVADVPAGAGEIGSFLEVWRLGFLGGAPPHTPTIPPSPVYRALCSPFSGAALAAPPLPGRGAAPHSQSVDLPISQFLCVLCGSSVPLWVPRSVQPHRRQRRQPGLQPLWLLQASKPLNFQASLERSSCPSCFPQNIPRFPIDFTGRALAARSVLCSPFSRGGLAAPYAIPFRLP